METPTVFTVGVKGTRLKAEVRVYKSQRSMLAAARQSVGSIGNDTAAFCEGTPSLVGKNRFAIIYFCRTHLTKGVVAHEMSHAAFCLLARRKILCVPCDAAENTNEEEMHAGIVGDLVDDFHRQYGV